MTVELNRPTAAAGAVTVQAGTVLECSASGRMFVTRADVVFGPADLGPFSVIAQAVEQSYEYNVRGERTAGDGTVIPGEIDTVLLLRESPPFGDTTIQVRQIDDAAGGVPPALDQVGSDRGIPRLPGEGDDSYRARLKQLPDTVSPGAIKRAAQRAFIVVDHSYKFVETWEIARFYDASDASAAVAYDMPDDDQNPFANRYQDDSTFRGAFIIVCDSIGCVEMPGIFYDDSAAAANQFLSPDTHGYRAVPAYDVAPGTGADATLAPTFDGEDSGRDAVYAGLWDVIQAIKPAGVVAIFELEGQ